MAGLKIAGTGAVVTGAGSGIGRGIALALARKGAAVMVADIEANKAEAVAAELRAAGGEATSIGCDVTKASDVTAMADAAWDRFGHVEILFNNAGVCMPAAGFDTNDGDLRWQFEVNVYGVFNGIREFSDRFMKQGKPAWICNTGSHHAVGMPTKGVAIYVATKHAVLGLTEALRMEHGDLIGTSILCPGIINTSLWDAARNRPTSFGGKLAGNPRNAEAQRIYGFSPERVGEITIEAIEAGDYFIWTHPQDIALVERRRDEAVKAVKRQWPSGPTAEHHAAPADASAE